MSELLYNAILTPDGTLLESRHVHDYRTHTDENGEMYMVDGGINYLRRFVCEEKPEELALYTDDKHSDIRDNFAWGTRGVEGEQPLEYKVLSTMSTAHIQAVLRTQHQIPTYLRKVFEDEVEWRESHEQ